jgi:hypothetical protein
MRSSQSSLFSQEYAFQIPKPYLESLGLLYRACLRDKGMFAMRLLKKILAISPCPRQLFFILTSIMYNAPVFKCGDKILFSYPKYCCPGSAVHQACPFPARHQLRALPRQEPAKRRFQALFKFQNRLRHIFAACVTALAEGKKVL